MTAFMDDNKDLFLYNFNSSYPKKISSAVESYAWHEEMNILVLTAHNNLKVIYNPLAYFLDEELEK